MQRIDVASLPQAIADEPWQDAMAPTPGHDREREAAAPTTGTVDLTVFPARRAD